MNSPDGVVAAEAEAVVDREDLRWEDRWEDRW